MNQEDQNDRENDRAGHSELKTLGLFGVIVADFLGYSGAGVAVGYFLWKKLSFPWWILLLTSFAGLYLASYQLYRLSKKDMK